MGDTLSVRSGRDDSCVVLWEVHPRHPGGEIFVAGDRVVTVARTIRVEDKLRTGELVEVERRLRRSEERQPSAPEMPFVGYDELTAEEIVKRFADLDNAARQAVRTYEQTHKARKTVMEAL